MINSIKNHNRDKSRVKEVIEFVQKQGGMEYASQKMYALKDQALTLLKDYPSSDYKAALEQLVTFVIERKK
jgi:octaprenyl-diphosphate synthase